MTTENHPDRVIDVLTKDAFDSLDKSGTAVLLFTAPSWCHPCRQLEPHFSRASEQLEHVKFIRVNLDDADPEWVKNFNIMQVPTKLRLEDGEIVGPVNSKTVIQFIGEFPKS